MTKKPENLRGHVLALLVGYLREHPLPKAMDFTRCNLGQLLDGITIDELTRAMEKGEE